MSTYDLRTKDDVVTWLKLYMKENNSKFVCRQVRSTKTGKVIKYRCEHWKDGNRHHKKKKIKGTGCKCAILFNLSRGLTNVRISHLNHNHSLTSAAVTSFHTPTEYVKQIFLDMFSNGAGPAEALNHYKNHVKNQCVSNIEYAKFSADKSKMPNYDWAHYLYRNQLKGKFDLNKSYKVIEEMKRYIEYLNLKASDIICKCKEIDERNFVVVIMTPLMKRICDTKCAGELVFTDSVGFINRFGLRVFLLMTKSNIGAIPVGVLITSNETVNVITEALCLFLEFVTSTSFGGRGRLGPLNLITDDCNSEIIAWHKTFPTLQSWLCTFHLLQHVHKWLWKVDNEITFLERRDIYDQVKKMMYAENPKDIKHCFDYITLKYNGNARVMKYINYLYQKKEKWCMCFRYGFFIRDFDANNIVELNVHSLKKDILNCIKNQSLVQLLSYITKEYSEFYSDKIISSVFKISTTMEEGTEQTDSDYDFIEDEESSNFFIVTNKKTGVKYSVNLDVGMCSCYVGCFGTYCKHQRFLNDKVGIFRSNLSSSELDWEAKMQLCYLATGSAVTPDNVFQSLSSTLSNCEQPKIEIVEVLNCEQPKIEIIEVLSCEQAKIEAVEVLNCEEPKIEVVEVLMQDCENMQSTTTSLLNSENTCTLELQEECESEMGKFLKNWETIGQIMLRNPAMYTSVLKSCNKQLTEMNNNSSKIISSLSLFGQTNEFLAERHSDLPNVF